jgi:hypothetical protein
MRDLSKVVISMAEGRMSAIAALCAIACCAAVSQSQAATAVKPNPPTQICINQQRVATKSAAVGVVTSGAIKWNPGQYMASGTVLYVGRTISKVRAGSWTPLDLVNAFNQTYKASHVFWTQLVGTETVNSGTVPDAAKWPNLVAVCAATFDEYRLSRKL